MAAKIRRRNPPPDAKPELDRVAGALKQSAERLKQASDQNDPEKLRATREVQALILAAKIYAPLDGRYHVSRADIDKAALPALRHRIILDFEGEAEGATSEQVLEEILRRR